MRRSTTWLRHYVAVILCAVLVGRTGAGFADGRRPPKPSKSSKSRKSFTSSKSAPWYDGLAFRSIDGSGNNAVEPFWGSAGSDLLRGPEGTAYGDGAWTMAGHARPSARAISNLVVSQPGPLSRVVRVTDMFWQWGQFLDHDLDLTTGLPSESQDISVPTGDPYFDPFATATQVIGFNRSVYNHLATPRQQLNTITAFIDASNVYGSDAQRAQELRADGGLMKMSRGRLLPFNLNGLPNAPDARDTLFLAGDVRANEQVGLTTLHTLFVREHNRLAGHLRHLRLPDETVYQVARAIVGAEMQAITYREFLPLLLGRNALPRYAGYDESINPGIANVFSTAAYRFGHTMVSPTLLRLTRTGRPIRAGHLGLRNAFFAPQEILQHGIESVLRGLSHQRAEALDNFIVDDLRNFLFGPPGAGGFDLGSLNIQRGRDHGLPGYNDVRQRWGMPRATTFSDISRDDEISGRLASAYSSVDDVDVWVGGLAEDPAPGAMVGPLFRRIIADQFRRLRDGDRFWYENLPKALVRYVERLDLKTIIRLNTSIDRELPSSVFLVE